MVGVLAQVAEIAVLLGLMCKYSCEECQLIVYGSQDMCPVELEKGTILSNMSRVLGMAPVSGLNAFTFQLTFHPVLKCQVSHHLIHCSRKLHASCKPHGCMFYRSGIMADQSSTLQV